MANLLYVDNSNVWIEGMHVAADKNGMAPDVWTGQNAEVVIQEWIETAGELGRSLPEPKGWLLFA